MPFLSLPCLLIQVTAKPISPVLAFAIAVSRIHSSPSSLLSYSFLTPIFPQWSSDPVPKFKPVLNKMQLSPQVLILTPQRGKNCGKNQISNIPTIFLKQCPPVLNQWHMLSECDSPNRIKMSRSYFSHNSQSFASLLNLPHFLSKWQEDY